ncbi:MAG: hypothetical protein ABW197_07190, partial [Methyloceanibacter sp.]
MVIVSRTPFASASISSLSALMVFLAAAAAVDERELPEREREHQRRVSAFLAQLESAVAAGGQLWRRGALRRQQR